MTFTPVLRNVAFKKTKLAIASRYKKAAAPSNKGFDQPRRFRRTSHRGRHHKRRFVRRKAPRWKLRARRIRFKSRYRRTPQFRVFKPRRKKPRRVLYWKRPRTQKPPVMVARPRYFCAYYRGKYVSRLVGPSPLLKGPHLSRRDRSSPLVFVHNPSSFQITRAQPLFHGQRFRNCIMRNKKRSALYSTRKAIQLVANLRTLSTRNYTDLLRRRNLTRAAAHQRLYRAQSRRGLGCSELRRLRSFAAEAEATSRAQLIAGSISLRRPVARSLHTRLLRRNRRRTTGFALGRRDKGKRMRVSRRVWRQGRRGYVGLFGKRRYRVARRDKRLVRRTSKRLATHRLLVTRALRTQATQQLSIAHRRGYDSGAAAQLLRATAPTRSAVERTRRLKYVMGRSLLGDKQYLCGAYSTTRFHRSSYAALALQQSANHRLLQYSAGAVRVSLHANTTRQWKQLTAMRSLRHSRHPSSSPVHTVTSMLQGAPVLPVAKREAPTSRFRLLASAALWNQKKVLAEKRFYASRPRLRLPKTTVTRRRRRKGGLGVFVQNTLRTPRTLAGLRNFVLAPTTVLSQARRYDVAPLEVGASDLIATRKRSDARPRHWDRRRLRWIDLAPAFWSAYSTGVRSQVQRKRAARRKHRGKVCVTPLVRLRKVAAVVSSVREPTARRSLSGAAVSALRSADAQRVLSTTKSARVATHSYSHSAQRHLSSTRKSTGAAARQTSFWHARSARLMQQAERSLSAWSPQYQTRWRRWASPRQDGILMRRPWPSQRTLRERRKLNTALLRRNLPQRRHWDRGFIHLQYYQGGAASMGYTRLRRSHRMHSKFSRWWKPVLHGVPFVHPYSRRALNSKRYYRHALDLTSRARGNNLLGLDPITRTRPAKRAERHMISRKIPWRNFNYPTPRRGAPATIQRWTVRYKGRGTLAASLIKPKARLVTLARSPRDLRQLDTTSPDSALWADRQWEALDFTNYSTFDTRYATKTFEHVPASVWAALRERAGSLSQYVALQRAILADYRRWSARVHGQMTVTASVLQAQSASYLVSTVQSILHSTKTLQRAARIGALLLKQRQTRSSSTRQRVALKRAAFIKHRTLPALCNGTLSTSNTLLARENSHLYKRWLHGAGYFLQQTQQSYIPTSRSRYSLNLALDFGRSRMRFPASGRRKRSFDSMLHVFVKRSGPSRFRRTANLRFVRLRPQHTTDFRTVRLSTAAGSALTRQRALIKKLCKGAAPSAPCREILNYRAVFRNAHQTKAPYATGKRRFIPLPANVLRKYRRRSAVKHYFCARPNALRAIRVGVLRRALRRRRSERAFIDLRKAAIHRRTPLERALRPGKLRRRARLKTSSRAKPWARQRSASTIAWGLSHLGPKGTRLSDLAPITRSASQTGELWSLPKGVLRRDRRALRGFSISLARRKRRVRRKNRDNRRGLRGRRRRFHSLNPRQAVFLKKHWSEGKELRGFRRLARRPLRSITKKFLTLTPKLFAAAYSSRRRLVIISSRRRAASAYSKTLFNTSVAASKQRLTRAASGALVLSSSVLNRTSSARRKLWLKKGMRVGLIRRKTVALARQQKLARRARVQRVRLREQAARYVGRLVANTLPDYTAASPIFFQNPTMRIVKSAGAKAKELEADLASKEERYKMTAQYVENLTQFLPELINSMFSKYISKKRGAVTVDIARHLIRNIYWSLRIYLNVDPFDTRFVLRDRNPSVRVRVRKIMENLAAAQRTEQPRRAALRYRFQPARLLRLRNKLRFRGDWLRNFLPAQHALYLENAEEYGLFLLRTQQIRRLRFGPRGVASWTTAMQQITQEMRARQLLTLRYSRATPRFETMLQGVRRVPDTECAPFVAADQAVSANFFARNFSTSSRRGVALVGKKLRHQTRLVSLEGGEGTAPFISIASRYRVISRVDARGKTSFVGTERPSMLYSSLDTRATRIKSPRSRQYLVRTISSSTASQLSSLRLYRETLSRLARSRACKGLTRAARRFLRSSAVSAYAGHTQSVILRSRQVAKARVTPGRLAAEQSSRAQRTVASRQVLQANRRVVNPHGWALPAMRSRVRSVTLQTDRFALQNRSARCRSTPSTFRASLVLPAQSIRPFRRRPYFERGSTRRLAVDPADEQLRQVLESSAHSVRRTLARMTHIYESTIRTCAALQRKQRAHETRLRQLCSKSASSLTVKDRLEIAHLPKEIVVVRKKVAVARKSYHTSYARALKRLTRLGSALPKIYNARSLSATGRVWGYRRRLALAPGKRTKHFGVYGGAYHSTLGLFTEVCSKLSQRQQQTPFDTYRTRLWNKLTLRRMKKERIVRYWIKGTSRWMRDPWVAEIVGLSLRSKPGRLAGELRPVEQQIGQYVPDVDARGKDIPYAKARAVERHAYAPRPQPKLTELKLLTRVKSAAHSFVRQRLTISKSLRRKPIPAMWLANYEYNDFWREFKEEKAKSLDQKREESLVKRKEALARAAQGLPPERERRRALKMPPLPKLPKLIWKEIHRRARRLEWRESDEVFFRKGFRNAFRFYPQERSRAPWLEALMYNRATFSTRLREFRRRQFPREQKKYKWLQRVRKALFSTRTNRYIRGRKWSQLRIYNQRLHYSLFAFPDRNAARRHFRKLGRRTRPAVSSFVSATHGIGSRLDVTLLHLKVVPSIFWARVVAPFGLLRVDGELQTNPAYRIRPDATIHLEWDRIARFQHFFQPSLSRREAYQRRAQRSTSSYPTNFEYHRGTRTLVYRHAPDESDLRKSSRLQANLFRWFRLDSA